MGDKGLTIERFNEPRSMLCRGCDRTATDCSYAHGINMLRAPSGARQKSESDLQVSVTMPGLTLHESVFMPLSECYRSIPTRQIDQDPSLVDDSRFILICVHWVRNGGKCLRWQNCKYLHPSRDALNRAFKHRFCPGNDGCYGSFCPLAHSSDELVAPDNYEPQDLKAHRNDKTIVAGQSVPSFLIMHTRSRVDQLCKKGSQCDRWSQCAYVHTWDSVAEACQRNPRLKWTENMVKRLKGF